MKEVMEIHERARVITDINEYFERENLPYTVEDVFHKSNHPDDDYLYMVIAKKNNYSSVYAVWTSWNTSTRCLNHGHYDLNIDEAKAVVDEFFSE